MAQLYDSEKLREAARQTKALSGVLSEEVEPTGRRALEAAEELTGESARALNARLEQLRRDSAWIARELRALDRSLTRYADQLEELGARLKEHM